MLQLRNIQKSFGAHRVYAIDELVIAPGVYWIKGANGSGKSTFLRMLAGMLPFKGEIVLNGSVSICKEPTAYRSRVNYAPAEPAYPSFLTGDELVNFVAGIKKAGKEQLASIKQKLGIDNYLLNPAGSYSSGMLKKLSLLLAFAGRPDWILLDEPFTTLDQSSQQALTGLVNERHREGTSFIFTSHHDIEAGDLSFSQVFLMKDQQLLQAP